MFPAAKMIRLPNTLPRQPLRRAGDAGMATTEYAIACIAAAAFAAVLYTVVSGDSVLAGLTSLVERALSVTF